jgi:hypothetical protein
VERWFCRSYPLWRNLSVVAVSVAYFGVPVLARADDFASTRTYLDANYRFVDAVDKTIPTGIAATSRLVTYVTETCPGILAGAPVSNAVNKLSEEALGAVSVAAFHPSAQASIVFARTVMRIRWRSHKITRLVRSYARKLRAITALMMPNLCADASFFRASDFRVITKESQNFTNEYTRAEAGASEVPTKLFRPYERADEKVLLLATGRLEARIEAAEASALTSWNEILHELQLES